MSHQPRETRVNTDTIECQMSGTGIGAGPEGEDVPVMTLADLKAFTARLDELGVPDDRVIDNDGATVSVRVDFGS